VALGEGNTVISGHFCMKRSRGMEELKKNKIKGKAMKNIREVNSLQQGCMLDNVGHCDLTHLFIQQKSFRYLSLLGLFYRLIILFVSGR
jgi:hypothetical protein